MRWSTSEASELRGGAMPRGPTRSLAFAWSLVCAGITLAGFSTEGRCQIYAGRSAESGAIVLSNFMSSETSNVLIADPAAKSSLPATYRSEGTMSKLASSELQKRVESIALRSSVSPALLHAVIAAESNYDVHAVSSRGAMGLMQLMPATAKRFGAVDPFDPEQNIAAGASYLKWLMAMFRDDLELVLAAYNAGEQAVIKAGRRIPPYPETQAYVKKVMTTLRHDLLPPV